MSLHDLETGAVVALYELGRTTFGFVQKKAFGWASAKIVSIGTYACRRIIGANMSEVWIVTGLDQDGDTSVSVFADNSSAQRAARQLEDQGCYIEVCWFKRAVLKVVVEDWVPA